MAINLKWEDQVSQGLLGYPHWWVPSPPLHGCELTNEREALISTLNPTVTRDLPYALLVEI